MTAPDRLRPGYRATLAALSIGQIVSWAALYYAFTAFVLPMQRELGWGKPLMMGAYTTGLALSAALSVAVGAAIDRGHGRLVLSIGPLLGGIGFALWSVASEPWMLYTAWLVLGVALALSLYEPAFAVVTRRYPERYRDAVATLTLVGGFASTLAFPALALLQAHLPWREVLLVIAAVLAFGVAPLQAWALGGPSITAPAQAASSTALGADMPFAQAVSTPAFRLLTATFAVALFTAGALWAHMVPALASKGLSDAQALAVLVWIGPAQVVGRVLFVVFGRWLTVRQIGLIALAGAPLGCLLFALGSSLVALLAFALLYGMANGVATLVRGALLPEYFGRSAIGRIGGLVSGIAQFARAAAPLASAWLLLALPGYRELLLCLAAIAAVGWLCFAFARKPA